MGNTQEDINRNHTKLVKNLAKPGKDILKSLTPEKCHSWHMLTLLKGEAGELSEALKKHIIYGKEFSIENVIEELGDIEFALEGIRQAFDIDRDTTLVNNLNKLNKRYSSGTYSDEQARNRADKQ